jgi:hypothetical protein
MEIDAVGRVKLFTVITEGLEVIVVGDKHAGRLPLGIAAAITWSLLDGI